jgi:hypothetical protein
MVYGLILSFLLLTLTLVRGYIYEPHRNTHNYIDKLIIHRNTIIDQTIHQLRDNEGINQI